MRRRASDNMARWEHFSHGADVGVRGFGISVEEAFEQAALALSAVVGDISTVRGGRMSRSTAMLRILNCC